MQEAVSLVYAKILEFCILAIKWYKKNKIMHSIASVVKPFSLSFKPILDEITERSRRVDELASAASKAEIRSLHISIHGMNQRLHQLTEMIVGEFHRLARAPRARCEAKSILCSTASAEKTLQSQIMIDLRDQKEYFQSARIEAIGTELLLEDTPEANESLEHCRSMRNRRRQKLPTQFPSAQLLRFKEWIADPVSSLLLATGQGVRTSAIDFAADFLDAVLEQGYPVLWALPSSVEEQSFAPTVRGILRSLVMQALVLNPGAVSEGANPVRMQQFRSAVSIEQWFKLLERCVVGMARLFVVIDMGLVELAVDREEDDGEYFRAGDFLQRIMQIAESRTRSMLLKAVVVSWQFKASTLLDTSQLLGEEQRIVTDGGRRAERLSRQPKHRATFKRRSNAMVARLKSAVRDIES
jgi:hypothetical protein